MDDEGTGWVRTNPNRPNNLMKRDERGVWLAVRAALLIVLGAIEEYLGMERSRQTKRKRHESD